MKIGKGGSGQPKSATKGGKASRRAKPVPSATVCPVCAKTVPVKKGVLVKHRVKGGLFCRGGGAKRRQAGRKTRVIRPADGVWGGAPERTARSSPDSSRGLWRPGKNWNEQRSTEE